jgi:hypothetical protein
MLSRPLRGQKFYATLTSVHKSLGSAMGRLERIRGTSHSLRNGIAMCQDWVAKHSI